MVEKKPAVSGKLIKKAVRLEVGGLSLMTVGAIEVILSSLSPVIGIVAIGLGALFFRRGRRLLKGKK